MKNLLRPYSKLVITSISLLVLSAVSLTAETITSSGHALITSSIDKDIYRSRAIENALQKIVLGAGQSLNSFSIVENGKVLLDQIHTQSAVKVIQYKVINESIKNKRYHVTVEALLSNEESKNSTEVCRKVQIESVNFSLVLNYNTYNFPAWADISKEWILSELEYRSFDPKLEMAKNKKPKKDSEGLYTLFKQTGIRDEIEKIYSISADIDFERVNKNNFIEKNIILTARINTSVARKDKVISQQEFIQPYVIHQKILNNSFLGQREVIGARSKNISCEF